MQTEAHPNETGAPFWQQIKMTPSCRLPKVVKHIRPRTRRGKWELGGGTGRGGAGRLGGGKYGHMSRPKQLSLQDADVDYI